ncbi:N-acetylmuramoyl-L-alanine amidase [Corallococcus sp. H22C18031201]|nr:N-acetylmuramoyl-L-alanine amidase [Corallococcus sp. H22C18031201]
MSVRLSHLVLPVLLLLAPRASGASKRDEAEAAYQQARRAYYTLKDDAARRKLRHHWLNVTARFEAVAARYPKSDRAPDALFTAAELLQELSRISFVDGDLQSAIADYTKLLEAHPKHRLADDAALALARIDLNRLDKPEAARRVLTEALATNPKSDQAKELRELLASLPPPPPKPTPAKSTPKAPPSARPAPEISVAEAPVTGRSVLVEAVTKLAREPSPMIPRLDPSTEGVRETSSAPAKESRPSREPSAPAVASAKDTSPASEPSAAKAEPSVAKAEPPTPKSEVIAKAEPTPKSEPVVAKAEPVREPPSSRAVASKVEARKEPIIESEPPRPVTAPVDERVAQARLKAVARQSKSAELTLAEQLGLKVRRVVIDPGHGGHDPGSIGKEGTREKDVALAISKRLAAELRSRGLEVLLTRDDDRFIRLEDRAKLANEQHGDLFISVHCNSAVSRKLRGIETYTLNTSADRYSIRLAARENASSEKGIGDLQFILADLATKANTEESSRLAMQVQKSLVSNLAPKYGGIKDLGHKEALFYVLLGAKMPAILVETAFISNAEEEERLASDGYQEAVAQSIAHGVEEFLGDRSRVAKVD